MARLEAVNRLHWVLQKEHLELWKYRVIGVGSGFCIFLPVLVIPLVILFLCLVKLWILSIFVVEILVIVSGV